MSRHGVDRPVGVRHRRVRRTRAPRGAARPRCAGGPAGPPGCPSAVRAVGGQRRRRQVDVRDVRGHLALGLEQRGQRVSRSSGTLTTPVLTVSPPKPPVSAWPRVSVLKTVVLPERASPTIAICTVRQYPLLGSTMLSSGSPAEYRAQVVAEQLDAPVEHAAAGPRRVGREDEVGHVVQRRVGRQRLLPERIQHGAAHGAAAERPHQRPLVDEAAAGDVDEPRAGLHPGQAIGRRTRSCGVPRQRQREDHEVALGEQLRQLVGRSSRSMPARSGRLGGPARSVAADGHDARAEGRAPARATARPIEPRPTTPDRDVAHLASPAAAARCARAGAPAAAAAGG